MRRIAVEEHFATRELFDCLWSIRENRYPIPQILKEETTLQGEISWIGNSSTAPQTTDLTSVSSLLLDMGSERVKIMDEAGIDMQILSLCQPGVQVLDIPTAVGMAKRINDELAKAIKRNPKRFRGFATLAPQEPKSAADELRRSVVELGLLGASIASHTKGEYLDDPKFWPIFEAAQELDVPIYLHPRSPSPEMIKPYLAYPGLASGMGGFAAEASLHAMRLILSGVFEKFPKLTIILGHLGEALPFWLGRIDERWKKRGLSKLNRRPSEYFRNNFLVTTSGITWPPALLCAYLALGADRILFAVDYPFESNSEAISFMETAPICLPDKEKIMHGNAERIFGL